MPNAPRMGLGTPSQMSAGPPWLISLETREMPPVAGRMPTCQRTASGSHSRGGSGYTGEPSSVVTPGSGSPSRRRGRGCPCTACAGPPRRATELTCSREASSRCQPSHPNGTGLSVIVRNSPAATTSRPAGRRIHSRSGGSGSRAGRCLPSAAKNRTGSEDGTTSSSVTSSQPASADVDGTDRPGQRVRGRRSPRAAPHRDGIAVRGQLPGARIPPGAPDDRRAGSPVRRPRSGRA